MKRSCHGGLLNGSNLAQAMAARSNFVRGMGVLHDVLREMGEEEGGGKKQVERASNGLGLIAFLMS